MYEQYPTSCCSNDRIEDFARPRIERRERRDDWPRLSDRCCGHYPPQRAHRRPSIRSSYNRELSLFDGCRRSTKNLALDIMYPGPSQHAGPSLTGLGPALSSRLLDDTNRSDCTEFSLHVPRAPAGRRPRGDLFLVLCNGYIKLRPQSGFGPNVYARRGCLLAIGRHNKKNKSSWCLRRQLRINPRTRRLWARLQTPSAGASQ
jgi:hypothetical protein